MNERKKENLKNEKCGAQIETEREREERGVKRCDFFCLLHLRLIASSLGNEFPNLSFRKRYFS